jgi:hypothetical protein
LDAERTFGDYQIVTGDSIVAVTTELRASGMTQTWLRLTKDDDHISEMLRDRATPELRREIGRLSDLALMKMERRPKQLRRSITRRMGFLIEAPSQSARFPTVVPDISALSELPLPFSWPMVSEN